MSDAPTELEPIPEPPSKRRSPLPFVLGIVAVLVLLVGVVIVASDDDDGGGGGRPLELLSSAPDAARAAGSARMRMAVSTSGGSIDMEIGGEGLVDFETGAGSLEMSMMGFDVTVLSDGETVWMQLPTGEVEGASWVAMPADAVEGQQLGGIDSATGMLEALRGIGAEEIEDLGEEEVNGVDARHYSTVVDLAAAIENTPETSRDETRAALEQFEALGEVRIPIDVWITDDGLPARTVIAFSPDAGSSGMPELMGDFDLSFRIDLFDFGTPVDIEPPDPSDVRVIDDPAEIQELLGGGGPFGGGAALPAATLSAATRST